MIITYNFRARESIAEKTQKSIVDRDAVSIVLSQHLDIMQSFIAEWVEDGESPTHNCCNRNTLKHCQYSKIWYSSRRKLKLFNLN